MDIVTVLVKMISILKYLNKEAEYDYYQKVTVLKWMISLVEHYKTK